MKEFKKVTLLISTLMLTLCIGVGLGRTNASAKASLYAKTMKMGIGQKQAVSVGDVPQGAKLKFKSSNASVASVNGKGCVTGKKIGNAKVNVSYVKKGKTTKVGTVSVSVKNAQAYSYVKSYEPGDYWVTGQEGYWENTDEVYKLSIYDFVQYMNAKASYKFYSSNTDVLKITTAGKVVKTAVVKENTEVKITIKETYKGKTRKICTFPMLVVKPSITGDEVTIAKGEIYDLSECMKGLVYYHAYITDDPDNVMKEDVGGDFVNCEYQYDTFDLLLESDNMWYGGIKGTHEGVAYVHLYPYNYTQKKFLVSEYLGYIKVTVKEINDAASIKTDMEMYPEEYENYYNDGVYSTYLGSSKSVSMYVDPYNYSGDVTVTSSDESVATVDFRRTTNISSEDGYIGRVMIYSHKVGDTTITVKANGAETSFKLKVSFNSDFSDYFSRDYVTPNMDWSKITTESSDESVGTLEVDGDYCESDEYGSYIDYKINRISYDKEVTFTIKYDGQVIDYLIYPAVTD